MTDRREVSAEPETYIAAPRFDALLDVNVDADTATVDDPET